jgi:phenol hydroxylase P0 protein
MTTEDIKSEAKPLQGFVRVKRIIKDKFVEFDFAVGDPGLYVELILPKSAFDAFCEHNNVIHMSQEQADAVDKDMEKWRYGKSGKR